MGGSKVAPRGASSIPRLELFAAVEASQAGNYAKRQLNETISHIYFYSDSKVTLAYIKNESKRFTKYVSRRAHIIRNSTEPNEWYFVNTKDNPADLATRPVPSRLKIISVNGEEGRQDLFLQCISTCTRNCKQEIPKLKH